MNNTDTSLAIIGYGKQMQNYILPSLQNIGGIYLELVCVSSSKNEDAIKSYFGKDIKIIYGISDFNPLTVDKVIVSANPNVNELVLEKCLESSVACFVEKPFTIGNSLNSRLNDFQGKQCIHIGYNFSRSPLFEEFKTFCEENGGISSIDIDFNTSSIPPQCTYYESIAECILYENGVHTLNLLQNLIGNLTPIFSRINSYKQNDVLDISLVLLGDKREVAKVRLNNGQPRFNCLITAYLRSGEVVKLEDFSSLILPHKIGGSSSDGYSTIVRKWPLRKSNLIKAGYIPCLQDFLDEKMNFSLERENSIINIINYCLQE